MREYLLSKLNESTSDLEKETINILLEEGNEDLKQYVDEIMVHGCSSGVVGSLTYYHQTNEFFKNNFDEIFDIYNEMIAEGIYQNIDLDSNNLAWLGFEQTVARLYHDYENSH